MIESINHLLIEQTSESKINESVDQCLIYIWMNRRLIIWVGNKLTLSMKKLGDGHHQLKKPKDKINENWLIRQ